MMSIFRKLFPLVVLLLLSSSLSAQTYRASLRGTINDQRGAIITGAQIRLTNTATGVTRTTVSGSDGEYTISSLSPGSYRLEVELQNFQKRAEQVEMLVNQEQRRDITLSPAGPDLIETVYGPTTKNDSASLGAVIENRQVVGLPLDGRNFYELTLLVPGAAPAAPGTSRVNS